MSLSMASVSLFRGSYRLFSRTSCKSLPRGPPSATDNTDKWKNYIKNNNGEDGEVIHSAAFGSVRLDSEQRPTQPETSYNVASIAHKREAQDNFFLEEDSSSVTPNVYAKPSTAGQAPAPDKRVNETTPKVSTTKVAVAKPKPKTKIEDSTSIKAYKYIEKLRNDAVTNSDANALPRKNLTKELEVSRIGDSLQSRVNRAMNFQAHQSNESSQATTSDEPLGTILPKFRPVNLEKLTSAEVIGILKASVIYNQDDIVAISKPYGLEMFGSNSQHSVEKYLPPLCDHLGCEQLYQVHRLDKVTSGILLLAKSKERHLFLANAFRQRLIKKFYWTIVNGTPEPGSGVVNIPLCEANINNRFRITVVPPKESNQWGKVHKKSPVMPAISEYTTLKRRQNRALLEVAPITGFKHQIRAHLGLALGTPVLGDHKFSSILFDGKPQKIHGDILRRLRVRKSKSRDLPVLLHAKRLIIPMEGSRDVVIVSKLPFHFNRIMGALGLSPS